MSSVKRASEWRFVEECGKRGHYTKASAKAHKASLRAVGTHVKVYLCEADNGGCGLYHVGHLPYAVRKGYVSDAAFYQR